MAHTALYGGTVYEKKGGADLVGGTVYKKDHGKVLVGGTVYEVGFGVPCTVTIVALGMSPNGSANVTLDGQTYSAKGVGVAINYATPVAELTVPGGTVMLCSAQSNVGYVGTISLNGTVVVRQTSSGVPATYDYTVNGNIFVSFVELYIPNTMNLCDINIYEIPDGRIVFLIGGYRYFAEEGTTWDVWVNSSDNTAGYKIESNYIKTSSGSFVVTESGVAVTTTDTIIANHCYKTVSSI